MSRSFCPMGIVTISRARENTKVYRARTQISCLAQIPASYDSIPASARTVCVQLRTRDTVSTLGGLFEFLSQTVLIRGLHARVTTQPNETAPRVIENPPGRWSLAGLSFWILFSVAVVFLRGIRWDEHWDLAQVILGRIPYPEEHFLFIWTRDVRNLPIYISSIIARFTQGPETLNAFRNILWLLATTIPVYLIGMILGRRALYGHVAVLFALAGLSAPFDASYPLYAWPAYFSNGHIGMGLGLLALAMFLAGWWRSASFLLGFMPCIHIIHTGPIAGVALAMALWAWRTGHTSRLRRALAWAIPGIIVSALLWTIPTSVGPPSSGPYYAAGDWEPIVKAYMSQGTHWSKPGVAASFTNSNFILAATLLLTLGAARAATATGRAALWSFMCLYLGLCAAAVWTMMALHWLFDTRLPYLLLASMPYRFTNHVAVLSIAILPAVLALPWRERPVAHHLGTWILACTLAYLSLRGLLEGVVNDQIYIRYLAGADGLVYGLAGAAVGLLSVDLASDRRFRLPWTAAWIATIALTAVDHQFGPACFLLGFAGTAAIAKFSAASVPVTSGQARHDTVPHLAALLLAAVALLKITVGEWHTRETFPVSEFDRAITTHLRELGEPAAMVASYPTQHRLQSRIGHPVLADAASADSLVYSPELAPSIQKIFTDMYGIRFHPSPASDAPSWNEIWVGRDHDEWVELSHRYGFSFVISPNDTPLDLEAALPGPEDTLYRISD